MDTGAPEFGQVDLTNCDREPIRIPGAVQPHGALLVLDPQTLVVRQVAGDIAGLLGTDGDALLGGTLAALLSEGQVALLHEVAATPDLTRPLHLLDPVLRIGNQPLDASLHRNDGGLVLEFEGAQPDHRFAADPLSTVQTMLLPLANSETLQDFCQAATAEVARVTGYDRVMIYRFLPDDSGWVFAETVRDGVDPFLELHYPASDIPRQARALYLQNWLRIIADIDYAPATLVPTLNPVTGQPLDMGHATLRAVSPVHLEYLRNMGVAATMTISVIRGGRLWGLIACHHNSPKPIPRHLRAICELFGQMFSLQLDAREQQAALAFRHKHAKVHADMVSAMSRADGLVDGLMSAKPNLLDYMDADGVALLIEGQFSAMGRTPRESQVRALVSWLDENAPEGVFVSNSLSEVYDLGRDFAIDGSGVLAISASRSPSDYILWFRPEMIETVRWGGDPTKPLERGPDGDRLTPRKSFDAWAESVRLRSRPWSDNDVEAARTLRLSLLEVVLRRIDQVARERGEAQQRHELMLAELNHRVKNTLATIQSLAQFTKRSSQSLEDYVHSFEQRIQAMAASHNLLTNASWEEVELRALVMAQLRPYARDANLVLDGPEVRLGPSAASPLGMVLHELATNAVKYGALGTSGGRVGVAWDIDRSQPQPTLRLTWRESGGPPVAPPQRRGFGTFTLERVIGFQVGGRSSLRFAPGGVECDIDLTEGFSAPGPVADSARADDAPSVLVVEDEAMVAFVVETIVAEQGWNVVGPVGRVSAALALASDAATAIDAAILDVNLAGEKIWPVADVLAARGIPFVFATGYDQSNLIPERFAGCRVIGKPFNESDVVTGLQQAMTRTADAA